METFSLYKLNEYIRRVIALNFDDTIWINAEISQVKYSRGNYYLDLIEKEEQSDNIKAKASAIIWYKKSIFLKKKFKDLFDSIIDTGNEIRIKIKVDFSERYGFTLLIEDLDVSYTLGKAEMLKQEILNKLNAENLIHLNGQLTLPIALQKIAIISSLTAAGYKDFLAQINTNSYGYHFETQLFESSMQGQLVEKELIAAIDNIEHSSYKFDCIVIIRGGGAKLDLSAFDNYAIAKRIADCQLPVITGIGHEIDNSITDIVSHTDLKTPTAVADFLIEKSLQVESTILDLGLRIQIAFREIMRSNDTQLQLLNDQVLSESQQFIQQKNQGLKEYRLKLEHFTNQTTISNSDLLMSLEKQIALLAPENVLKRGFAIVRQKGKAISSVKDINKGQPLESQFLDGKVISIIK